MLARAVFVLLLLKMDWVMGKANMNETKKDPFFQVIYWSTKPYIYEENGSMEGIIPDLFDLVEFYCSQEIGNPSTFVEYKKELYTMNAMLDLLKSNVSYGKGHLENITIDRAIWLPFIGSMEKSYLKFLRSRNKTARQLYTIEKLAVITQEREIIMPHKLALGIINCGPIIVVLVVVTMLFSVFIWFIERCKNKSIPNSFLKGTGASLWMCIVTLVTVGYGDVVPRSALCRCFMAFWMVCGIIMAAITTATITDTITSDTHLAIHGKRLSVINQSFEASVVKRAYSNHIVLVNSYTELLSTVRRGDVFAAVMDAEIAAWYEDFILDKTIVPRLNIVKTMSVNIPLSFLYDNNIVNERLFDCIQHNWNEIITYTKGKYATELHTQTLKFPEISEMLTSSYFLPALLLTGILGIAGIIYDLAKLKKCHSETARNEEEKHSSIPMKKWHKDIFE